MKRPAKTCAKGLTLKPDYRNERRLIIRVNPDTGKREVVRRNPIHQLFRNALAATKYVERREKQAEAGERRRKGR